MSIIVEIDIRCNKCGVSLNDGDIPVCYPCYLSLFIEVEQLKKEKEDLQAQVIFLSNRIKNV